MKLPVKVIDFDATARIQGKFRDCVGLYDANTKTIYLSKTLPRFSNGTLRSTYEHEMVHAKLDAAGVTLRLDQEEGLATLLSVIACPARYLSHEEQAFKAMLSARGKWARLKDRPYLIRRACGFVGVKPTKAIVKALTKPGV